jgi:hypothetical protein
MRADEPGTAGDEYALSTTGAHVITILFLFLETIKAGGARRTLQLRRPASEVAART